MDNNENNKNKIILKYIDISRFFVKDRVIQLSGLAIALLTLIVTIAPDEVRNCIGLGENQENRSSDSEPDKPKISYAPFEYTINEHRSLFLQDAQTSLSVVFQNIEGEDFVSLHIFPAGGKSSVRAVLRGYTEELKSSTGVFNVQVLDIDGDNKKVLVQVSRTSQN